MLIPIITVFSDVIRLFTFQPPQAEGNAPFGAPAPRQNACRWRRNATARPPSSRPLAAPAAWSRGSACPTRPLLFLKERH